MWNFNVTSIDIRACTVRFRIFSRHSCPSMLSQVYWSVGLFSPRRSAKLKVRQMWKPCKQLLTWTIMHHKTRIHVCLQMGTKKAIPRLQPNLHIQEVVVAVTVAAARVAAAAPVAVMLTVLEEIDMGRTGGYHMLCLVKHRITMPSQFVREKIARFLMLQP